MFPLKFFLVGSQGSRDLFQVPKKKPLSSSPVSRRRRRPGRPLVPIVVDHRVQKPSARLSRGSMVSLGRRVYRYESDRPRKVPRLQSLRLVGTSPWAGHLKRTLKGSSLVIGQGQRWLRVGGLRVNADPHVQLVHAEIAVGGDRYYVHPYAPTFLNGNPIFSPTPLKPGDSLTVGATSFKVRRGDALIRLKKYRPVPSTKPTFSLSTQKKHLDFLLSPDAVHHPHLIHALAGANVLPEGRALRYAQLLSEVQANIRFLENARLGRVRLEEPDQGYDFPAKHVLRNACEGLVRQPDYTVLHYTGRQPNTSQLRLSEKSLQRALDLLENNKLVFLKPVDSSASFGVSRLELSGNTLNVFSSHSGFLRKLLSLPRVRRKSSKVVVVPFSDRSYVQVLRKVLDHYSRVIAHAQGPDKAILEGAIRIPKLDRKTWEIRNFHQEVKGKPMITYQYAKVGKGSVLATIAAGGSRADSLSTVKKAYRQRYPSYSNREIEYLARAFLERVKSASHQVVRKLEDHLRSSVDTDGQYPLGPIKMAHVVVDFTGEFDEDGILQPVLVEVNKVGSLHPRKVVGHKIPYSNLQLLISRESNRFKRLQQAA